jgi:L-amino acid N-acyltransferase YncA
MTAAVSIGEMEAADWPRVRNIYLEGIATGDATFQTAAPAWEEWNAKHHPRPRLLARVEGETAGWAALSPVSERAAYAGVAEVSVYVSAAHRGRGAGRALLRALVTASEAAGIWTLQAGIFPENAASLGLHEACGFRRVGVRERIGRLGGAWRDVVLLERRSAVVGL